MKNNIVPIIIAIIAVVAVVVSYLILEFINGQKVPTIEDFETQELQNAIYVTPDEETDVLTVETKEIYGNACYVTVELVERTITEDKDGNSTTNYDKYVVSEVNLKEMKDWTEDYYDALYEDGLKDNAVKSISFEDGFNFSYKDLSGWELYEKLLETNHICVGELSDVTFDRETEERTGQKLYVFNKKQGIIDKLLEGEVYDQIVNSKVYYEVIENEDGVSMPDNFYASVTYEYDGYLITKSAYLEVYVNSFNMMEGLDEKV